MTSGPSFGSEEYSVYTNLSDEELIQIAIERSLSEYLSPEVRQPSSSHLPSTSAQPDPQQDDGTHARPSTSQLPSTSPQPDTQQDDSTNAKPSTSQLPCTSTQPRNQHVNSINATPSIPTAPYSSTAHYSSANPPCAARVQDPLMLAIRTGDVNRVSQLANIPGCNLVSSTKPGWLAIHQAAYYGQEACLRVLLTAHPGMLNKKITNQQTALMLAVNREHTGCVRLLLERGADPDIVNEDREAPLNKACERNNTELVAILLSHGAAVNTPCSQGYTALHAAVSQNNVEICEMLVKAGAKISATSKYGVTPLSTAAQSGKLEALCFLLKHGADINGAAADGATPLYEACKNGHVSTVEMLLSLKADVNRSKNTGLLPIHVAAQKAHSCIVSLLIPVTSRNRITSSGISPLHIAAEQNHNNIMELLLEAGFDPNCQLSEERRKMYEDHRSTALFFSVYNSNMEATEMLLEAGAYPNLDLFNPLLVSVRRGSMEMASLLLKYGADVNASISIQPSAFPSAVLLSMDHLPMLKLLLDHGCNASSCFHCVHGSQRHPTQTQVCVGCRSSLFTVCLWNRDAPWSHLQDSLLSRTLVGTGATREFLKAELDIVTPESQGVEKETLWLSVLNITVIGVVFCEAVSTPSIIHLVGPLVSLLLNYVSHVRLCSRLMEHLNFSPLLTEIQIKAVPPHPLMQLCRLRIRHLVGVGRLKLLRDLDLPSRLIKFLCYEEDCCSLDLLDT